MSDKDKSKKDYDPTLLRAVGNILAGHHGILSGYPWSPPHEVIRRAVQVVLLAKAELKKQSPVEE